MGVDVALVIGNSDDKLTQKEWSQFHTEVHNSIMGHAEQLHGVLLSEPSSEYQTACWIFEIDELVIDALKKRTARIGTRYEQDSVAWLQGHTQFLE